MVSQNSKPEGAIGASVALASAIVVGWLDALSTPERLLVDYAGSTQGPLAARTTVALPLQALARCLYSGTETARCPS
jgi:hypothetical protein